MFPDQRKTCLTRSPPIELPRKYYLRQAASYDRDRDRRLLVRACVSFPKLDPLVVLLVADQIEGVHVEDRSDAGRAEQAGPDDRGGGVCDRPQGPGRQD